MLLRIEDLWVRYGGITALSGITIDVPEGETVLLVGANGAGKSSTINAIIGLVPAAKGRILFNGQDLCRIPCERRARFGIGYSPEGRRVFPTMSVTDNPPGVRRYNSTVPKGTALICIGNANTAAAAAWVASRANPGQR